MIQGSPQEGILRSTTTKKTLTKQKSFPLIFNYPKLSFYFLATSATILLLFQIQALNLFHIPNSITISSQTRPYSFLPLKNLSLVDTAMDGNTWFMSAFDDIQDHPGGPKHLYFPSKHAGDNRLLCLSGRDGFNGTKNSYALARPDALPPNARLLPGLTFVSDTYYDYENLFHGLTATMPFVAWHQKKSCAMPARWVLYHQGEIRKRMSTWVGSVIQSVFGRHANVETFEGNSGNETSCFERTVVIRHSEGSMSRERKEETYAMIRCKARAFCDVTTEEESGGVRVTLFLRTGARSFKDEAAVVSIFHKECKKVAGCKLKVAPVHNLTFCDQVKLMSSTDILATSHGAQLTNMFFMDKNSSIMEFFPKGWHDGAGAGQYVYQWIAISSGMRHKGAWEDPNGEKCPENVSPAKCFSTTYKDGRIGHDKGYFAKWAAEVIGEMREYKLSEEWRSSRQHERLNSCACTI